MEIKISIVIPVYNASKYVMETLQSIKKQSFSSYEIIIVNDCSTDDSVEKITDFFNNNSFKYLIIHNKVNKGVSFSRNAGLAAAKGEYVAFIDADDLISESFLSDRYEFLKKNPEYLGCCSRGITFYDKKDENVEGEHFLGASVNLRYDILSYQRNVITCPSNYLFRRKTIIDNKIFFNEKLSSSADRYFLLALGSTGPIGYIESSPFFYRVQEQSMSHNLTVSLLKDNEKFKKEVLKNFKLDNGIKRYFLYKVNYILGGGYFKLKKYPTSIFFLIRSYYYFPFLFFHRFDNK